jgi:hypothetical protein
VLVHGKSDDRQEEAQGAAKYQLCLPSFHSNGFAFDSFA